MMKPTKRQGTGALESGKGGVVDRRGGDVIAMLPGDSRRDVTPPFRATRRQFSLGSIEMARILVVDDSPDAGDALAKVLTASGHDVDCVPNGQEALARVIDNRPDVVLIDLLMPEMDGPSFLEVVRSYLRLQSLPVVVLTALENSPMIDRVQALKVNSVLIKGKASSDDILKALDEAIVRAPG